MRIEDDGIERARAAVDNESANAYVQALATIAVAEQLKRIADNLERVTSNGRIGVWARCD